MQGYFRDDAPLCELVLDEAGRRELDCALARARLRDRGPDASVQGLHLLRTRRAAAVHAGGPSSTSPASEDKDCDVRGQDDAAARRPTWPRPARTGRTTDAVEAIETYFATMSAADSPGRAGPPGRRAAPPRGAREVRRAGLSPAAARRPSTTTCWRSTASSREQDGLGHEDAIRDAVASVLLSPHFCYRVDPAGPGAGGRSRCPTTPWRAG